MRKHSYCKKPHSIRKIEESQAHIYYENLSEQMQFRTQRLKDDFELEKKKRVRKEEDLKDAEDQITKLQQDLKKLEDLLERTSKRALAIRNKDDSPESHASKKTKIEEPFRVLHSFLPLFLPDFTFSSFLPSRRIA